MRRTAAVVAVLLALMTSASWAAQQANIYQIQTGSFAEGTEVTVGELTDVVVTASGRFGFCIQEVDGLAPPPYEEMYCGIWVYTDGTHVGAVSKGDLVVVTGNYDEYYDLSEIDVDGAANGSYEVVGSATVPEPVELNIVDINTEGPFGEQFESVLVRVDSDDSSLFARNPNFYGEWYLSTDAAVGQGDSIMVDSYSADPSPEGDFDYPLPEEGDEFTFLAGMLTYSYGNFKIAPRSCSLDLGFPCPPVLRGAWAYDASRVDVLFAVPVDEISAEDPINYYFESGLEVLTAARDESDHRLVHLTTGTQVSGLGDILYVEDVLSEGDLVPVPLDAQASFAQGITSIYQIQHVDDLIDDASPFDGAIVTTTGRVAWVDGNAYYLQQGDAGPFMHLHGRVAPYGTLAVGDSIKFAGVVDEYFGATYVGFAAGIQYWENLGPATDPVVTTELTADQMIFNAYPNDNPEWPWPGGPGDNSPEPYEDALVHLSQVAYADSVDGEARLFGEWWLFVGDDSCRTDIMHDLNGFGGDLSPRGLQVGDSLDLTGILRYEVSLYRLIPRMESDVVIVHSNMGIGDDLYPLTKATLSQNQPNPFVTATTMRLRLEDPADAVSCEIYDVTGACVRHLLEEMPLRAGETTLHWDGRSDLGRQMPSGTYFYRLTVDGRSEARQMIRID